jgi:ribosomal protein S27E
MSKKVKKPLLREGIDVPFGPPPEEYKYRCSVCGTELMVNEAIIDAGIGMAQFNNEYYEGFMPKVGCPGCNNYTMEYVEE